MNEAAEYRANAELCRRMADDAQNDQDKRAWLEMARSWSFLTKLEDVVASDGLDVSRALDMSPLGAIVRGSRNKYSLVVMGIFGVVSIVLEAALSSISRGIEIASRVAEVVASRKFRAKIKLVRASREFIVGRKRTGTE